MEAAAFSMIFQVLENLVLLRCFRMLQSPYACICVSMYLA